MLSCGTILIWVCQDVHYFFNIKTENGLLGNVLSSQRQERRLLAFQSGTLQLFPVMTWKGLGDSDHISLTVMHTKI